MVHGDDFVSVGEADCLHWLRCGMEKRFKIKTQLIGRGKDKISEGRILNRVIRYTDIGWEYEPDQRHAELIVRDLGLEDAKGVSTPGDRLKEHELDENL